MTAVDELRSAIAEIPAVDQHAHLLARPGNLRIADVLTESRDPEQIHAVHQHPAHHRALRELSAVLGIDASEEVCAAAREADFTGYATRLLAACRLDAMFVDDGFRTPEMLSLEEHAALVDCPVRRVIRIETEAEAASSGWPPFATYRERFQHAVADAVAGGAVALKTIAAYRCGLDLPAPSLDAAVTAYDAWRRTGSPRLCDATLVSLLLADALEAAGGDLPLQVHTGLGDADQMLVEADPALLQRHFDGGLLARTPVVLLHCYPYVRHAGYLASLFSNVHIDLSLAITLVPQRGPDLVLDALDLAPATKLLFATDASRLPEMFLLGTRWFRESLARALGRLIEEDCLDERRALEWAHLVMAGNARRLYGLALS